MTGTELFDILVQNTGLPESYVRSRLERLICENGGSVDLVNLDQIRDLLSDLLLELIEETQQEPA